MKAVPENSASQAGGGSYWANVGNGTAEMLDHLVVGFGSMRFGSFALSHPLSGNSAPVITALVAEPYTAEVGEVVTLGCSAADFDGDSLSYSWTGGGQFSNLDGGTAEWQADNPGDYQITCTVADGEGHVVSAAITVMVVAATPNQAPQISDISADPGEILAGEACTLNCTASDPDGDELSYSWSGPGSFGGTAQAETSWSHDEQGVFSLVCTVDDGRGLQAMDSVTVTVTAFNVAPEITAVTATPDTTYPGEAVHALNPRSILISALLKVLTPPPSYLMRALAE